MKQHKFSHYNGNIKDSRVMGTTNLYNMLCDIVNPDDKTVETLRKIRTTTDPTEKARLKTKLKGYTPCVICRKMRRYDDIESFSGLLALDFDKLDSAEYAIEFKEYLFNQYPYIYATWLSASGKGVRGIVKIPVCKTVDEYKAYYGGVEQELGVYTGFDIAPKNAVLPLFQSYDPNLLYRKEPTTFTRKYYEPEPVKQIRMPITANGKQHESVIKIITSAIDKIGDNGHPQLRGASVALGGYVGAGYIDYYDAVALIDELIDGNKYLKIKPGVYKKTARTMIKNGTKAPLYL